MNFETRFLAKLAQSEPSDRELLEEALSGLSPEQIEDIMRPDFDCRQAEQAYEKIAELGPLQRAFLELEQYQLEKQAMTMAGTALKGLTGAKPVLQRGLTMMSQNPQAALMTAGGLAGAAYGGLKSQPIDPQTGQRRSRLSGAVRGGLAGVGVGALAGQSGAITKAVSDPGRIAKLQAGLGTKGVAGTLEKNLAGRAVKAEEAQAARAAAAKAEQSAAGGAAHAVEPPVPAAGGGAPAPAPAAAPPPAAPPAAAPPAGAPPAAAAQAPSPVQQRIQSPTPSPEAAAVARGAPPAAPAAAPPATAAGPGMQTAAPAAPPAGAPPPPPPAAAATQAAPAARPGPTTDVQGQMPAPGAGEQVYPRPAQAAPATPAEAVQQRIQSPAPSPEAAAAAGRPMPGPVGSGQVPEYAGFEMSGPGSFTPTPEEAAALQGPLGRGVQAVRDRVGGAVNDVRGAAGGMVDNARNALSVADQPVYSKYHPQGWIQRARGALSGTTPFQGKKKLASIAARYGLKKRAGFFDGQAAPAEVAHAAPAGGMFPGALPASKRPFRPGSQMAPVLSRAPSLAPGSVLHGGGAMFSGKIDTNSLRRAAGAVGKAVAR